jgi:hypothetical protein
MAEVCVKDIRYDDAEGVVEIPMMRREAIKQNRKGCLGWWKPPYKVGQKQISSALIIRQVTAMRIKVDDILVKEDNSCFTIMMGVQIQPNEISLGSLEEVRGKTLCEIFITVEEIDIELNDRI